MFKVAAFHRVETSILGAWFCDVFGQDPKGYNYDMFK